MFAVLSGLYHSLPSSTSWLWNAIRMRRISYRLICICTIVLCTLWTISSTNILHLSLSSAPPPTAPETWAERANQVKHAFLHAYHGYERYGFPHDELRPVTNRSIDSFNGWGVTVFDSLDTMILMGLDDEFNRSLPLIRTAQFTVPSEVFVSFFETTIRYLGGLLSAYTLSHETILLEKADELGRLLSPAFNTPTGFPKYSVNTVSGKFMGPDIGILAEISSCQLEYTYLAKLTGKKEHFDKANRILQMLTQTDVRHLGGMLPVHINISSGDTFDTHLSVGGQADSAHEYLLKQYLLTARTDKSSLEMYLHTTAHILTNLMYLSPTRQLLYVTDIHYPKPPLTENPIAFPPSPTHRFEHLSCFLPGLLALGLHSLPFSNFTDSSSNKHGLLSSYNLPDLHLWAAVGLAETCWLTYADQVSGLGPDEVVMVSEGSSLWIDSLKKWKGSGSKGLPPGIRAGRPVFYTEKERADVLRKGKKRDYLIRKPEYVLRPETIESMYILWRVTGDVKWRERGWTIFQAIEKQSKTPVGYASIRSVEYSPAPKDDTMPSYFLAETLKYLYLLFTDEDILPLDKFVFNTEAHPFPIFHWTNEEKEAFTIELSG